ESLPKTVVAASWCVACRIGVIDVGRDEHVQPTVAIEVEKCAPRIPTRFGQRQPASTRDIVERAVAVVAIKNLMAVVSDEQVDVAVVVVVAGADALSPAFAGDAGLLGDVGKRAVVVVSIQVTHGRGVGGGKRSP